MNFEVESDNCGLTDGEAVLPPYLTEALPYRLRALV